MAMSFLLSHALVGTSRVIEFNKHSTNSLQLTDYPPRILISVTNVRTISIDMEFGLSLFKFRATSVMLIKYAATPHTKIYIKSTQKLQIISDSDDNVR